MSDEPLRIGILGAARIAPAAIVQPAQHHGHRLVAVAARDPQRAAAFAAEQGIERVAADYQALLDDPEVEVVYNALPNGLHGRWNLAAIAAGKHVLSEKPFAANAIEAAQVRAAADGTGLRVVEAFHYLHHPVFERLLHLVSSGELGEPVRVESTMHMTDPGAEDPRWAPDLAGGAMMDLGCYSLHTQRTLGRLLGGEPVVCAARGAERAGLPGIDTWLDVDLAFPNGVTGIARTDMDATGLDMSVRVVGTEGSAKVCNFISPVRDDRLEFERAGETIVEHHGTISTYTYQLAAFAAHVRHGAPFPTDADDAVTTMQLIDTAYRAAGFAPRQPTAHQPTQC